MMRAVGDVYLTHILSGRCDVYASANVIMPHLLKIEKCCTKTIEEDWISLEIPVLFYLEVIKIKLKCLRSLSHTYQQTA